MFGHSLVRRRWSAPVAIKVLQVLLTTSWYHHAETFKLLSSPLTVNFARDRFVVDRKLIPIADVLAAFIRVTYSHGLYLVTSVISTPATIDGNG